jgi:hypothetical protein
MTDQATYDAMLEHQARCGCILPANLITKINPLDVSVSPQDLQPPTPGQHAPGFIPGFGWYGTPMDQPSEQQNRTTEVPFKNHRQRHPSNPTKLMNILKWQEDNPDTWPDGNPT